MSNLFSPFPHPASPEDLQRRLALIRFIVFDVDGVLTDGRLILSSSGEESKRFHIKDGLGIVLAQKSGLHVALMSGRTSAAVERRAKELGIRSSLVLSGTRDKIQAMQELKQRMDLPSETIAFIGDDLNDLPVFNEVGLAVAVADAATELIERAHFVTEAQGGGGAAREIIERILKAQGRWDSAVENYLQFLRDDPADTQNSTPQ